MRTLTMPPPAGLPAAAGHVVTRRYELDWLRVIATGLVFLFHSARFFDFDDWHVKNAEMTLGATIFTFLLAQIIMPLFFVLSGMSTTYAWRGQPGRFLRERSKRLLVPLGFGIIVLSPPQIYLERLTHGQYSGSFIAWLPHYLDGFYLGIGTPGNFAWMGVHLWYLLFLFLFTLLTLPLFLVLDGARGQRFVARLVAWLARPGWLIAAPLPLLAIAQFVDLPDPGGWNLAVYLVLFVYGYLFLAADRLRGVLVSQRWWTLAAGVALMAATLGLRYALETGGIAADFWPVWRVLRVVTGWLWLLAALGQASASLTVHNRALRYANEAVLPFYILHQPVILLTGFLIVVPLAWPVEAKYLLVLVLALPIILGLYEFGVRRVRVVRYWFGLKPRTTPS